MHTQTHTQTSFIRMGRLSPKAKSKCTFIKLTSTNIKKIMKFVVILTGLSHESWSTPLDYQTSPSEWEEECIALQSFYHNGIQLSWRDMNFGNKIILTENDKNCVISIIWRTKKSELIEIESKMIIARSQRVRKMLVKQYKLPSTR